MSKVDAVKRGDQLALLKTCLDFTDTGKWNGIFTYPNCGWDLVQSGLATSGKRITAAGRAALWLAGKGEDPIPDSKSSVTFTIPVVKESTTGAS